MIEKYCSHQHSWGCQIMLFFVVVVVVVLFVVVVFFFGGGGIRPFWKPRAVLAQFKQM